MGINGFQEVMRTLNYVLLVNRGNGISTGKEMPKKIEMTGKRLGRLIVIEEAKRDRWGKVLWTCICDCGNIKVFNGCSLRQGDVKSCGCLHNDLLADISRIHGMHGSPEYISWANMIQRCTNKNNPKFPYYGGRGISVCKEWRNSFATFYQDMGPKPKGLTIERKNNELGYFKKNCIWANRTIQARNRQLFKNNKVKLKGIHWDKRDKKYIVQIGANGKQYNLGYFNTIQQAVIARRQAEQDYWGNGL